MKYDSLWQAEKQVVHLIGFELMQMRSCSSLFLEISVNDRDKVWQRTNELIGSRYTLEESIFI